MAVAPARRGERIAAAGVPDPGLAVDDVVGG